MIALLFALPLGGMWLLRWWRNGSVFVPLGDKGRGSTRPAGCWDDDTDPVITVRLDDLVRRHPELAGVLGTVT